MSKYKYTIEQAKDLYARARRLKLLNADYLADPERVAAVCNGVGPACWPEVMRKLADKLSPVMELAAAIHDIAYAAGGDDSDRLAADLVFRANCLISIEAKYPWYHPGRYVMRARASRYYEYLRIFGGGNFYTTPEKIHDEAYHHDDV